LRIQSTGISPATLAVPIALLVAACYVEQALCVVEKDLKNCLCMNFKVPKPPALAGRQPGSSGFNGA